jgi:ribosome-associated toxin RatA of RatAB toxin-antitoxin module
MPEFSTKRRVRHSASDMFDLVADVERYPQFVPLCSAMKLRSRTEQPDGKVVIVAEMTVAYKLIRETFRSRARLDRSNLRILVSYLDGPFSRMENRWAFVPVDDMSIERHLRGSMPDGSPFVMGVYPMLADDTCWFLAADFDEGEWQRDVSAFAETCRHQGVPIAIERSRSGNGAHAWIFFEPALPAASSRSVSADRNDGAHPRHRIQVV